jgi:tellurium resistance protein TerD
MLQMTKGSKLKMQKTDGSAINAVRLELSWDAQAFATGAQFDLDVSAIALVDAGDPQYPFGKGFSEEHVLYYNSVNRTNDDKTTFVDNGLPKKGKPTTPGCAMIHSGDSRDGASGGADETVNIFFDRLPDEVNVIHVVVTIDDAVARKQNFGQVRNSNIKVFNADTNDCLANYDLEDDAPTATALLFVELRKKGDTWSVNAVNQGFDKGLGEFFALYGFATE